MRDRQKPPDEEAEVSESSDQNPGLTQQRRDKPVNLTAGFMRRSDQQMVYLSKMYKLCLEMLLWGKRGLSSSFSFHLALKGSAASQSF